MIWRIKIYKFYQSRFKINWSCRDWSILIFMPSEVEASKVCLEFNEEGRALQKMWFCSSPTIFFFILGRYASVFVFNWLMYNEILQKSINRLSLNSYFKQFKPMITSLFHFPGNQNISHVLSFYRRSLFSNCWKSSIWISKWWTYDGCWITWNRWINKKVGEVYLFFFFIFQPHDYSFVLSYFSLSSLLQKMKVSLFNLQKVRCTKLKNHI